MPRACTNPLLAAAVLVTALAPARADARKPTPTPPPAPTADQQLVIAQIVNQTFPLPKRAPLTLALCLDIQIGDAIDEDAPPPPAPKAKHRGTRKPAAVPASELPRPPVVRGAPPELVQRLARPWRLVASASSCRLDPRLPVALPDEQHTSAQLVTVHLAPDAAAGTIQVDWTDPRDPAATNSRDCTAARAPAGWTVHCGGTWYQ
ncbi:MAG TPA: hypothetical protein VHL80_04450 [Polyangia bacterium]|nr:hypothetical protein [Polyangia bacterium]